MASFVDILKRLGGRLVSAAVPPISLAQKLTEQVPRQLATNPSGTYTPSTGLQYLTGLRDFSPQNITKSLIDNLPSIAMTADLVAPGSSTIVRPTVKSILNSALISGGFEAMRQYGNKEKLNTKNILSSAALGIPFSFIGSTRPSTTNKSIMAAEEKALAANGRLSKTVPGILKSKMGTAKSVVAENPLPYTPMNLRSTMETAGKSIRTKLAQKEVLSEALSSSSTYTPEFHAKVLALFKKMDDSGDKAGLAKLWPVIRNKATEAGQTSALFKELYSLSPEAKVRIFMQEVDDVARAKPEIGAILKTSRSTLEKMLRSATKIKDPQAQGAAIQEAFSSLSKDIPMSKENFFTMWRYSNILSNPATWSKNLLSNIGQTAVDVPATMAAQGNVRGAGKYYAGLIKSIPQASRDFTEGWRDPGTSIFKGEIRPSSTRRLLEGQKMTPLQNVATMGRVAQRALESTDRFFSSLIRGGLENAGVDSKTAAKRAETVLFRSDYDPTNISGQGKLFSSMDRAVMSLDRQKWFKYIQPIIRTPYQFLKEGLKRSPVGAVNILSGGVADTKEAWAQVGLGMAASLWASKKAFSDETKWEAPDPKDFKEENSLFYAAGYKPRSIKIGNGWVPLEAFGPYGISMSIPMLAKHYLDQDPKSMATPNATKAFNALWGVAKYMASAMPVSQGLNLIDAMTSGDEKSAARAAAFFSGQFQQSKGLMTYFARIVDDSYRRGWALDPIESFMNYVKKDIPFASKTLEPYKNPLGEEEKRNPSYLMTGYDVGREDPRFTGLYEDTLKEQQQSSALSRLSTLAETGSSPERVSGEMQRITDMISKSRSPGASTGITEPQALTVEDILNKKNEQDRRNSAIDKILKLPVSFDQKVKNLEAQGFTQEEIDFRVAHKVTDTKDRSEILWEYMSNGTYSMTKLYESDLLNSTIAKQWERDGKIPDADALMEKLKLTDVYEQRKYIRGVNKKLLNNVRSRQKKLFTAGKTYRGQVSREIFSTAKKVSDQQTKSISTLIKKGTSPSSKKRPASVRSRIKARRSAGGYSFLS